MASERIRHGFVGEQPRITARVGSTTNVAGTFTGLALYSRFGLPRSALTTAEKCYICSTTGRLVMAIFGDSSPLMVCVERSHDATRADTGTGMWVTGVGSGSNAETFDLSFTYTELSRGTERQF